MNKKCINIMAGLIVLFSTNSVLFADIILKNDSYFNIKYRFTNAQKTDLSIPEYSLGADKEVHIKDNPVPPISIRYSGPSSSITSRWTDVPNALDLARQKLSIDKFHEYDLAMHRGEKPIITINSSYSGGWSFSIWYKK